jgi:class 3 adenylate cyclase
LRAVGSSFLSLIAVSGLLLSVLLILLQKTVLSRLLRLAGEVQEITRHNDLHCRVHVSGQDELADLGTEINQMLSALESEKEESERLLHNILPQTIAARLKRGETMIAERFNAVTVVFCDLVGFTRLAEQMPPEALVAFLNRIFSSFDALAEKHGLEKIKTLGDAYMAVAGLPTARADHLEAAALMALEMRQVASEISRQMQREISVRIGMNTGEAVAGIIGIHKFSYDLWGDVVNTAARMEAHGQPGMIHCTEAVYQDLQARFAFAERGLVSIKNKGDMRTYFLLGELNTDSPATTRPGNPSEQVE